MESHFFVTLLVQNYQSFATLVGIKCGFIRTAYGSKSQFLVDIQYPILKTTISSLFLYSWIYSVFPIFQHANDVYFSM